MACEIKNYFCCSVMLPLPSSKENPMFPWLLQEIYIILICTQNTSMRGRAYGNKKLKIFVARKTN
jgi:hypothetical protein